MDRVRVRVVGTEANGLAQPRDLAFNPEDPTQLWVVDFTTSSMTIFLRPGTATQQAVTRGGPGNLHFLAKPSCLAFGAPGNLATAHETAARTQPTTPPDFMGPTLWDSTLMRFNGGDNSHLDMLHNSPNSVGIAWETATVYWVVDGAHRALARYNFRTPHERGGVDHSDGELQRFANGMVGYTAGVSSHAEYDQETRRLYFADTGNRRIASFDSMGATRMATINPNYDGGRQSLMTGGTLETFIDGTVTGPGALERPSGLALAGGRWYVTDNATSRVLAFDREGRLVDWLDLSGEVQPGALMGVTLDARGWLYLTDAVGNRVLEVSPAE
jgi:sugar lactone lactonase YvrE